MHVLFVHQNFPAQFGHIASHLAQNLKWPVTFVTNAATGKPPGVEIVQYKTTGGATAASHFCSRTFENYVWHADAIYHALRDRPDLRPDLIVAHGGLGSAMFLRELYPDVPAIGLFEYFYRPHDSQSDMTFRHDLGWKVDEQSFLRARSRNAMLLLELQNCQLGYCPTEFQRSCLPAEYQAKTRVIFDGINRAVFNSRGDALRSPEARSKARTIAGINIPPGTKIVTYCSSGFESMRGFDIFMKAAKLICEQRSDVIFLVAGDDRVVYGGDANYLNGKTMKQWVLAGDSYDLSRIRFLGMVPRTDLAEMLAASDLHMYLTVPFVLSWSMMNAMSCGAVVLGSRTAPVQEMITDGQTGLLADFFSPAEFAEKAVAVLNDPDAYRPIGRAAEALIERKYSADVTLPQMVKMYEEARTIKTGLELPRELAVAAPRQIAKKS
ncbi:glycosyltransferase family 4 protein [soil metagenome]